MVSIDANLVIEKLLQTIADLNLRIAILEVENNIKEKEVVEDGKHKQDK